MNESDTKHPWDAASLAANPQRRAVMMKAAGVPIDKFTKLHLNFPEVFRRTGMQTKKAAHEMIDKIRKAGHSVSRDSLIEVVAAAVWHCRDPELKYPADVMVSKGIHAVPDIYLQQVQETLGTPRLTHTPLATPKPGERFLSAEKLNQAATDTLAMLAGTKPFPITTSNNAG